jgi:hypothetical protein
MPGAFRQKIVMVNVKLLKTIEAKCKQSSFWLSFITSELIAKTLTEANDSSD